MSVVGWGFICSGPFRDSLGKRFLLFRNLPANHTQRLELPSQFGNFVIERIDGVLEKRNLGLDCRQPFVRHSTVSGVPFSGFTKSSVIRSLSPIAA